MLATFGGLITIFGGMYNQTLGPNESLAHFIFLGTNLNKIYFMMHFYLLVMGLSTILTNKSYRWNDVLTSHVIAISYLIYVYILVKFLDLTNNVTGLAYGDWLGLQNYIGEYATVFTFFITHFNKNLEWFQVMWISYFLVWLTVVIIMILKNVLVRSDDKRIKFWSYRVIYNPLKKSKRFLTYKVKNYLLLKTYKISSI